MQGSFQVMADESGLALTGQGFAQSVVVSTRPLCVFRRPAVEETRKRYLRLSSNTAASPVATYLAQDQPPLVGRQAEWKVLQDAWFAAGSGQPQCVMLTGETGIGKTRLAEALLTWIGNQGFAAAARCYAAEGGWNACGGPPPLWTTCGLLFDTLRPQ